MGPGLCKNTHGLPMSHTRRGRQGQAYGWHVWGDEVVHGLGITGVPAAEGTVVNPHEEELHGIWE